MKARHYELTLILEPDVSTEVFRLAAHSGRTMAEVAADLIACGLNQSQLDGDFTLQVKTRLLERGLSVTALATSLRLARNTVSMAINHPTLLPTVKNKIRETLNLTKP